MIIKMRVPKFLLLLSVCTLIVYMMGSIDIVKADDKQDEAKVNILLDGDASYDGNMETLTANGNVRVTYKGDKIVADTIVFNKKSNSIDALGNVRLERDKQEIKGDSIEYNLKTREGKVINAVAKSEVEGGKGFVYLKGREIYGGNNNFVLNNGSLTTCELAKPHYHIEAKKIELYIDDKIVIHGLSYYEGGLRIFYWPYFVFPLKKENTFSLPQIGYSEAEGFFIKTAYNYYFNANSYGLLHLDWYQKLGLGTGADYNFKLPRLGSSGLAKLYYLDNKKTDNGDLTTELKYDQPLPLGWDSSFGFAYNRTKPNGIIRDEKVSLVSLKKNTQRFNSDTSLNLHAVNDDKSFDEIRAVTKQSAKITDKVTANLDASYARQVTKAAGAADIEKEVLTYKAEIIDNEPTHSISVVAQETLNPDRNSGEPIYWMNLAKLPEATVNIYDIGLPKKIGSLPIPRITTTLTGGRYRELGYFGELSESPKGEVQVGFMNYPYQLTKSIKLDVTEVGRYSIYSRDQQRLAVSSGIGVTMQLLPGLSSRIGYQYDDYIGETPFYFDKITRNEGFSVNVDLRKGSFTAAAGTNYNFFNPFSPWGDLAASVKYEPSDKISLTSDAKYSINNTQLRLISGSVKLKPSDAFDVSGALRYNYEKQKVELFDGSSNIKLGDLRFGYSGQWDNTIQTLTKNDFKLGYHMHCREISLTYRQTSKQFWLEYKLDALPSGDLKVGGTAGSGMMIDVEGLDTLLNQ